MAERARENVGPAFAMTMAMEPLYVVGQLRWQLVGANPEPCAWRAWIVDVCPHFAVFRVDTQSKAQGAISLQCLVGEAFHLC